MLSGTVHVAEAALNHGIVVDRLAAARDLDAIDGLRCQPRDPDRSSHFLYWTLIQFL